MTLMVQLPPALTLAGQLFVCVKLFALVPVIEIPVIVNAAVPVFESVTVRAALLVFTA